MVSIVGLKKSAVLAALYNASRPQGLGFLQYNPQPMTEERAEELLRESTYFDYLSGRVMKLDLSSDEEFNPWLYDRDNGDGAAARAILELRKAGTNSPAIQKAHATGKWEASLDAKALMEQPTTMKDGVMTLGLDDVKDDLSPAIEKAMEG
jgi:hypothetical protein